MKKVKGGDKIDSKTLWTVVIVVIVASLITAFVAVYLTRSVIKVPSSVSTVQTDIYSKIEVDSLMSNIQYVQVYGRQGSAVGDFFADGKTGNEYCKANGYLGCLAIQNIFSESYFNSKDLSCQGGVNYVDYNTRLNIPADCNTRFDETFYNSWSEFTRGSGFTSKCSFGGYGGSDHYRGYSIEVLCFGGPVSSSGGEGGGGGGSGAYTLAVAKLGKGSGTVTSSSNGINCGKDCSESYTFGKTVTLTASPSSGSTFSSWSGACSGTRTCIVVMNAAKSVAATFVS